MYHLDELDVEATLVIIQYMLSISNSFARALIDFGATHSFISLIFAKCLFVKFKALDSTLIVDTHAKGVLVSNIVYKSYRVNVANRELALELLLLDF